MASNIPEVHTSLRPIYDMVVQSQVMNMLTSSIDLRIYDVLADFEEVQPLGEAISDEQRAVRDQLRDVVKQHQRSKEATPQQQQSSPQRHPTKSAGQSDDQPR